MISKSTKSNWEKLNVKEKNLDSRANKRLSRRMIIPYEYFVHKENIKYVIDLVETIQKNDYDLYDTMFSLCLNLLKKNNIDKPITQTKRIKIEMLLNFSLPENEDDILGIVYQLLSTEGEKNKKGAYYTPRQIVEKMTSNTIVKQNEKILDPCCGTGAFLCKIKTENPENLYGCDIDEISVMIAKTNILIKYKNYDFVPNIFCMDYLENSFTKKFDYIITNPPWGAMEKKHYFKLIPEIKSGESFSFFILNAMKEIKKNGKIIFLLPSSFLNIKIHSDIRKYIIENSNIEYIECFKSSFNNVSTDFLCITLSSTAQDNFLIKKDDMNFVSSKYEMMHTEDYKILLLTEEDKKIIRQVYSYKHSNLEKSEWALGVVTGDNKNVLQKTSGESLEPIYTGKEVAPYTLTKPQFFISFSPEKFQQTAPEKYYRAKEKLVYKFISKKLTFAYDNSQSLVLNSANILIPVVDFMSTKTILTFLNSSLYKFIYHKLFGDVKILKGNLMKLPFPKISEETNRLLTQVADDIINGDLKKIKIADEIIFDIFSIDDESKKYIKSFNL